MVHEETPGSEQFAIHLDVIVGNWRWLLGADVDAAELNASALFISSCKDLFKALIALDSEMSFCSSHDGTDYNVLL